MLCLKNYNVLCVTLCLVMAVTLAEPDDGHCSNLPPGVQKMFSGVDITKLDLNNFEGGADGIMSQVVTSTCKSKNKWTSHSGTVYEKPDQVSQIMDQSGGSLSANTKLYKSSEELRNSLAVGVGLDAAYKGFAFSASSSYAKLQESLTNSSNYISEIYSFYSSSRVDLNPSRGLTLEKYAQEIVDNDLTGTFDTNPAAYEKFIKQFGTHYFSTGYFGGYIRVIYETSSSYYSGKTDEELKADAKASYMSFISVNGNVSTGSKKDFSKFTEMSSQTVKFYGGDTNLLSSDGVSKWQPTVEKKPWLFSAKLRPISELIKDETKKSSMEIAVANYVMKIYLDEVQRLINVAKRKGSNSITSKLQSELDSMKPKGTLTISEVENLKKKMEEQLTPPEWFIANTQLCYNWRGDDDVSQCGGGVDGRLCAGVNRMTPAYLDNTDDRWGGCRMQWGIMSAGYPSWFEEVEICYRWYADGDAGMCGGGALPMLCAKIGKYTDEYRDDTDKRSGGCKMSWMIDVPTSAPLWMRTAQICFSWYPEGDAGQCGAPSRNLCALANQWTDYYRDATDGREGGCRMSWGIKVGF